MPLTAAAPRPSPGKSSTEGGSNAAPPPALTVERYSPTRKDEWNKFIQQANNASFLFHRDYMEYHQERFCDYSLMVFRGPELLAVLPANLNPQKTLISHEGLTYGGLITSCRARLKEILSAFHAVLSYLEKQKIGALYYKRIPSLYCARPDDEIAYCLFLLEARLYRRDCFLAIPLAHRIPFQKRRARQAKKATRAGLRIVQEKDFRPFWDCVLTPRLLCRYGVRPVHSAAEIELLASRFPGNIKQFSVYAGDNIVAGMTIYETPRVAHAQYIATSEIGRRMGALDLLVSWLVNEVYQGKEFFDFGGSNEEEGRALNHGLLEWKEGFGARSFAHDFYQIPTSAHTRIDPVLTTA